jgi:hypothetical protein
MTPMMDDADDGNGAEVFASSARPLRAGLFGVFEYDVWSQL